MVVELSTFIEPVVVFVEATGVAIIVIGLAISLVVFLVTAVRERDTGNAYEAVRRHVARSILLGLEILVAGDIVRTVAVDPTLNSVGVLAGIVVIRTFLSFTLQVEATGRWPWQHEPKPESSVQGG